MVGYAEVNSFQESNHFSELGAFASWREEYPNPRVFNVRKVCAGYENY
jgi:hypothetical protein